MRRRLKPTVAFQLVSPAAASESRGGVSASDGHFGQSSTLSIQSTGTVGRGVAASSRSGSAAQTG